MKLTSSGIWVFQVTLWWAAIFLTVLGLNEQILLQLSKSIYTMDFNTPNIHHTENKKLVPKYFQM